MNRSFNNVMKFLQTHSRDITSYHNKHNVIVNGNCLYQNIEIGIYEASYGLHSCYKVDIVWEEDESQVNYKEIGLHGSYSSDYQTFKKSGNDLTFKDGNNNITILG